LRDRAQTRALPPLQRALGVFTACDLEAEAQLVTHALAWMIPSVPLVDESRLPVGPAARHALAAANNLLLAARPGPPAPAVLERDPIRAAQRELDHVREALVDLERGQPSPWLPMDDDADGPNVNGGGRMTTPADLVVIHWLRHVVSDVLMANWTTPAAETAARAPAKPARNWIVRLMRRAVRRRPPPRTAPAEPAWMMRLHAFRDHQAASLKGVLDAWCSLDLLTASAEIFDNSCASSDATSATLLMRLHASPGGLPLCRWMIRQAATRVVASVEDAVWLSVVERYCRLGERLLAEDRDLRGVEIAGWMLEEVWNHVPETGKRNDGKMWKIMSEHLPSAEPDAFVGFPEMLGAFLRQVAKREWDGYRQAGSWEARLGRSVLRAERLADHFLSRQSMTDPHWHLMAIRLFSDGLRRGSRAILLPFWARCSPHGLYDLVGTALEAFGSSSDAELATALAAVADVPWHTIMLLPNPDPNEEDASARLRNTVAQEARAALTAAGHTPLDGRTHGGAAHPPTGGIPAGACQRRGPSPLDRVLNNLLAPDRLGGRGQGRDGGGGGDARLRMQSTPTTPSPKSPVRNVKGPREQRRLKR
jgi:hypothetical protein